MNNIFRHPKILKNSWVHETINMLRKLTLTTFFQAFFTWSWYTRHMLILIWGGRISRLMLVWIQFGMSPDQTSHTQKYHRYYQTYTNHNREHIQIKCWTTTWDDFGWPVFWGVITTCFWYVFICDGQTEKCIRFQRRESHICSLNSKPTSKTDHLIG